MPKLPAPVGCSLVFFALVGILAALLLPAIHAAREAARRMSCCPKQLTLAFHNYHDTYGSLPPAYTVDENGNPLHSWRVLLLPFMERHDLYKKIRLDEPWDSPHNSQFHKHTPFFTCPSRPEKEREDGLIPYQMVIGPDTISDGPNCVKFSEITRKSSEAILFVEASVPVPWMSPQDVPQSTLVNGVVSSVPKRDGTVVQGIGSPHHVKSRIGAYVAMVDGSVTFFYADKVTPEILLEMSRIRDTNPLEQP